MARPNWRGAPRRPVRQDGGQAKEALMRSRLASQTAAAAGTVALVGLGTPVVATLVMPFLFPAVVAALALWAWRADGR